MLPDDTNYSKEAKAWVDNLDIPGAIHGSWRLQIMTKRYRKDATTGKRKQIPIRIRRFVNGCPWSLVDDVIRYLVSKAPYTGVIYNGVTLAGSYRPTLTAWERDEKTVVDKGKAISGTYTLIQDLIEESEELDSESLLSESSCTVETVTDWVWDSPDAPDLSSMDRKVGETLMIREFRRNEDGTYDYSLIRRKAKTSASEPIVAACDSFEKVTTQTWDNVYPGPDGTWQDDAGNTLGILVECNTPGKRVRLTPRKNDDCTYSIQMETSETTASVDTQRTCTKTVLEHTHIERTRGESEALPEAPEAKDGVIKFHQSELQQDGTWVHEERTVTELPVNSHKVVKEKTLRGIVTTITDRNSTDNTTNVTNIGDKIEVEMTDGKRYNRTVTSRDNQDVGTIGKTCTKTVFEHRHGETVNVATEPTTKDVSSAEDGLIHRQTANATENGTWDVQEETIQEQQVPNSEVRVEKTIRGIRRTVTDRNATAGNPETNLAVGDQIVNRVTDGGRVDRTKSSFQWISQTTPIQKECRKSVVTHTDQETKNVAAPSGAEATASVNQEQTISYQQTEDGSWDETVRNVTHSPSTTVAVVSWPVETITTTETINCTELTGRIVGGKESGGQLSLSPNEYGGSTKREVERKPIEFDSGWITWESTHETPSLNQKFRNGVRVFRNLHNLSKITAGMSGRDIHLNANINDFGLYDGTATYSDLISWKIKQSSGGGTGGSKSGTIEVTEYKENSQGRRFSRKVTINTIAYYGVGNEGSEADDRANAKFYPGITLPARTYIKSIDTSTSFLPVK